MSDDEKTVGKLPGEGNEPHKQDPMEDHGTDSSEATDTTVTPAGADEAVGSGPNGGGE